MSNNDGLLILFVVLLLGLLLGATGMQAHLYEQLALCSKYQVNINACTLLNGWDIKYSVGGV